MSTPENDPLPKPPAALRTKQVPWGAPKPTPPPKPAAAPEKISAKKVPWGARKPAPPSPLPAPDETVTHMPWAEPTRPPLPVPPKPAAELSAKKIPWGAAPKPAPSPAQKAAEPPSAPSNSWALPKSEREQAPAAATQSEMNFARESRPADDREPTAEQLVAFLSRLTSRRRDQPEPPVDPLTPYKARPISFEPSRWEALLLWVGDHRRRLTLAGTLLVLTLATAYLMKLVSLNTQIDREWLQLEKALRDRYALIPQYVDCVTTYSDNERFTMTMTERALKAWRTARSDRQLVNAAVQMERALQLLTKTMNRLESEVPAKDPWACLERMDTNSGGFDVFRLLLYFVGHR